MPASAIDVIVVVTNEVDVMEEERRVAVHVEGVEPSMVVVCALVEGSAVVRVWEDALLLAGERPKGSRKGSSQDKQRRATHDD